MKRFFSYLGVALITLFAADRLLALAYDFLYNRMLIGQTGGKLNRYLTLPQQPSLVVMGNSRAYYQVIPDSFSVPTYNLCHAGMSQIFQTGLLSVISSHNRLPRTILLHLDPSEYTTGGEQPDDIKNLKHYYNRDTSVTRYINQLGMIRPMVFLGPWLGLPPEMGAFSAEKYKYVFDSYRYNGRVINLVKNAIETTRIPVSKLGNGYEMIVPTERDSINTIYSARHEKPNPAVFFHPERLRHLRQFLAMCRAKNVRVIGFTSPLYKAVSHDVITCNKFRAFMQSQGLSYIDYVNQPLVSVQGKPKLWKDARHLNHLGAQLESQDLARKVNHLLTAPAIGEIKLAPLATAH
jgi:hypothetical protein